MWRSIVYIATVLRFLISSTVANTITVPLYKRTVPSFYAANGNQLDDGLVRTPCLELIKDVVVTSSVYVACRRSEHRQPTATDAIRFRYQ